MSPTVFQIGSYRFYFFSREEERMHIHIVSPSGEAKFWIEPTISLAAYSGLSKTQLNKLQKLVEEHKGEITKAWQKHFKA
jgi:replication initiation and membrane attachment protein DnaB